MQLINAILCKNMQKKAKNAIKNCNFAKILPHNANTIHYLAINDEIKYENSNFFFKIF